MNKIYLFLLCCLTLTSANAWSDSFGSMGNRVEDVPRGITLQKIATLSNDKDKNILYLNIMIDQAGLAAGMYSDPDSRNVPNPEDRGQNVFWLRDIESQAGVVLNRSQGRDILIMKGLLNRSTQEGKFTIKYLSNGFTMKYKTCDFLLKKNDGKWWVKNAYTGAKVTKIHVTTWSLGVTTLEGICPVK